MLYIYTCKQMDWEGERESYWSVQPPAGRIIRGTNPENNAEDDEKNKIRDSTGRLCAIIYDPMRTER